MTFPFAENGAACVHNEKAAPPEDLLLEAGRALDCGAYCKAEALLTRLVTTSPGHPKALARLARICADQGRHDEALRHIEGALAADGMHPSYHYLQAAILAERGLKREASAALRRALYLDPDFALAHVALGNLALGGGNRSEADRHFDIALSLLRRFRLDDVLPEAEGMTVGSLIESIQAMKAAGNTGR